MWFKKNKRLLTIVAVIAALCLVLFGLKACFFSKPKNAGQVTAAVTYGDVEKTVLATGELEPVKLVSVGAQASGQVTSLKVDVGNVVRKGDLIAQIDPQTQTNNLQTSQARLNDSRAQLAAAQATLANAQSTFVRQQTLYQADAGARSDYEAAQASLRSAEANVRSVDAQIRQAEIAVRTASLTLGYTRITAPIDGTILAIVTKEGQTVNANQTAPTIVKMGQLDRMTVKAEISEADVIRVKPGMQVYFTILGDPTRKFLATVRSIEPAPTTYATTDTTDAQSNTTAAAVYYYGLFDVDNPDGTLRPSMTAQVSIVLQSARHVLTIPAAALGRKTKDGGYMVRVDTGKDKPEMRKVTIGVNDGSTAQVLTGLKAGEKVVVIERSAGAGKTAQNGPGGAGGGNPLAGGAGGGSNRRAMRAASGR